MSEDGGRFGTDVAANFAPGAADMPREEVSFIIGSETGPLSPEDFSEVQFAVSLVNVGPHGGPRDGATDVTGNAPDFASNGYIPPLHDEDMEDDWDSEDETETDDMDDWV